MRVQILVYVDDRHPDRVALALEADDGTKITALLTPGEAADVVGSLAKTALKVHRAFFLEQQVMP